MKFENLYRLVSRTYYSDLSQEELSEAVASNYNLNQERGLASLLVKEQSDFEGELKENRFVINQNNAVRSTNDGIYFFFTQINGEFEARESTSMVKVNVEVSQRILQMIAPSLLIYLVIILFGGTGTGLICIVCMAGMFVYGRARVKKDFQRFEADFKATLKLTTAEPQQHTK